MTIDERVEVLVQTVELMAQMHRDNERKYDALLLKQDERVNKTDERIGRLGQVVESLYQIAQSHEQRLDRLES